jgi:enterochelin esterase-like enzyme
LHSTKYQLELEVNCAVNALEKLEMVCRLVAFKIRVSRSKRTRLDARYRVDQIASKHLEGNTLGCPSCRDLRIYLPPGYFESGDARYPVIYLLHGYNAGHDKWTITSRHELGESGASLLYLLPKKYLKEIDSGRLLMFYEQLDTLIEKGELPPFILVQPDGSLRLPVAGKEQLRGSFYVSSARSGNFPKYIIEDVISHVDRNYRTIAGKPGRALVGGSMGGYGALLLASLAPDAFTFVGSSCPMEFDKGLVDKHVASPLEVRLLGRERAERAGKSAMAGLITTINMVVGEVWDEHTMRNIIADHPDAFKSTSLYLSCEAHDELGLETTTKAMHETMERFGIPHEFIVGSDPRNALSPHTLGSLSQIKPVFQNCAERFKKKTS